MNVIIQSPIKRLPPPIPEGNKCLSETCPSHVYYANRESPFAVSVGSQHARFVIPFLSVVPRCGLVSCGRGGCSGDNEPANGGSIAKHTFDGSRAPSHQLPSHNRLRNVFEYRVEPCRFVVIDVFEGYVPVSRMKCAIFFYNHICRHTMLFFKNITANRAITVGRREH